MNVEAPSIARTATASSFAVILSLAADAALVKLATFDDRSIRDFSHFRFADYGTLTIIGVIAACVAWLIVTHLVQSPRTLFFRLAIVMTLVLWIPDLWLFFRHENTKAVMTLVTMHVAIAIITYNLLVRVAPARTGDDKSNSQAVPTKSFQPPKDLALGGEPTSQGVHRSAWIVMMVGVCVEFAVGIAALLFVPYSRPNEWIPHQAEALYLVHAIGGGVLAIGAATVLAGSLGAGRIARLGALIGLIGIALGAGGGVLAVYHPLRVAGMALMFVGGTVAFFGYITPLVEQSPSGDQDVRLESDNPNGNSRTHL